MSEVKSATRVMHILILLSELPCGLTLTEISEALNLPKSSSHEILHAMVGKNFLQLDNKKYRIGLKIFEIGQATSRNLNLLQAVRPHLKWAGEKLGQIVQFAILDKTEVVYLSKMQSQQTITLESRVGARLPAHATALGKAMLSLLPEEVITETYSDMEFQHFTRNSIGSFDELLTSLRETRASSYAEDHAEYTEGVFCISVPIPNFHKETLGAVSISMSQDEWNRIDRRQTACILESAGKKISESMATQFSNKYRELKAV